MQQEVISDLHYNLTENTVKPDFDFSNFKKKSLLFQIAAKSY
jgi:hypothetical protein